MTASAGDGTQVWDAATSKLKVHFGDARATYAVFSPDGNLVGTAYDDGKARIWKVETGEPSGEPVDLGHAVKLWSVEFSRDGRQIVTASDDKTARVWDLEKRELVSVLRHTERIYTASFSPDNKSVVTGSEDNLAYVWDIATSDVRHKLVGHQHWVNSASFSRDGTRIVTGSKDGTARVRDARREGPSLFSRGTAAALNPWLSAPTGKLSPRRPTIRRLASGT